MDATASINFQRAKSNSTKHMTRESYVSYLLEHGKEFFEYKKYSDIDESLELAKVQSKLLTKRTMQSLAVKNFVQEAVVNIKQNTKIEDIENVFKNLNKKFGGGFKVFDISVHKDEGVFVETELNIDDIKFNQNSKKWLDTEGYDVTDQVTSYAPNKDLFYDEKSKSWYREKEFENKIDTSKFQKYFNLHAHVKFTKFDFNRGKNIRLQKSDMQQIQTITAETLKMKRGFQNSKTIRKNHHQLKQETHIVKATKEDVQAKYAEERKRLKDSGEATQKDYQELKIKFDEFKIKLKNKELTISDLKKHQEVIRSLKKISDEEVEELQKQMTPVSLETIEPATQEDMNECLDKGMFGKTINKEKILNLVNKEINKVNYLNSQIEEIKQIPKTKDVIKTVVKEVPNPIDRELKAENTKLNKVNSSLTNENELIRHQLESYKKESILHKKEIAELESRKAEIVEVPVQVENPLNKALEEELKLLRNKSLKSSEKKESVTVKKPYVSPIQEDKLSSSDKLKRIEQIRKERKTEERVMKMPMKEILKQLENEQKKPKEEQQYQQMR